MKKVYEGKTKTVYELENGNVFLHFKDDATGKDGVFDPGENTVGLIIPGMGAAGLRMSVYFFELLRARGVKTHFVRADFDKPGMEVLAAKPFGNGLEAICRFKATGSFMRRYGGYAAEGQDLDALFEATLKDDDRGDPVVSRDTAAALGIITAEAYDRLKEDTRRISMMIRDALAEKGLTLYDIKLEFGMAEGDVLLIDEISAGNMRVYRGDQKLGPLEIGHALLG